ncbi:MAG: hypothetical protein RIT45_736 [Pseudomonadota bacterium]|jgi:hypothetical protein
MSSATFATAYDGSPVSERTSPLRSTLSPRHAGADHPRRSVLLAALGLVLSAATACGAVQTTPTPLDVDKITVERGERSSIPGTGASLEIPKPFERKADRVFVLQHRGQVVALLTVELHQLGDQDPEAVIDKRIEAVRRSGMAGILRDERVELGDLDGRLIEAIDLVGAQRNAMLLVAVESERGLVLAQIVAPVALLKARRAPLEAALRSLRVASPREER